MSVPPADHAVARLRQALPSAAWVLGELESLVMPRAVRSAEVDRPIYVTGLARAGTTVLTEVLANLPETATHRYCDRALPHAAVFWRGLQRTFSTPAPAGQERAHGDGLVVTRHSPEAAEEPIWRDAFGRRRVDAAMLENMPSFPRFYRNHIAKLLRAEDGRRYLAKNNELAGRLGAILALFRAPRVVVVVRDPVQHIASLMRLHERFLALAEADPRVPAHLRALGHTEFGPQRRAPIAASEADAARIERHWARGDEAAGWILAWQAVYQACLEAVRAAPDRVTFVRHADLVAAPRRTLQRLVDWLEADPDVTDALDCGTAKLHAHRPTPVSLAPDLQELITRRTRSLTDAIAAHAL